jgi:hypothetical protein
VGIIPRTKFRKSRRRVGSISEDPGALFPQLKYFVALLNPSEKCHSRTSN